MNNIDLLKISFVKSAGDFATTMRRIIASADDFSHKNVSKSLMSSLSGEIKNSLPDVAKMDVADLAYAVDSTQAIKRYLKGVGGGDLTYDEDAPYQQMVKAILESRPNAFYNDGGQNERYGKNRMVFPGISFAPNLKPYSDMFGYHNALNPQYNDVLRQFHVHPKIVEDSISRHMKGFKSPVSPARVLSPNDATGIIEKLEEKLRNK